MVHLSMIKTYYVNCGSDIQLFINGATREEAEPIYWSLFNHGATNQTDPEWVDENTVMFWKQKDRLIRAFRKAAVNAIADKHAHKFQGKRGALIPALVDKLAARRWENCIARPYIRPVSIVNLNCYALGTIRAEKPDSDYGNRETL